MKRNLRRVRGLRKRCAGLYSRPHFTIRELHVDVAWVRPMTLTEEPSMRVSGNSLRLAIALAVVSISPGVAIAASSVTGTITFAGKVPALRPLAMDADPACAKKHTGPVANEMLALGSGNTMGNILVWVSKASRQGRPSPSPRRRWSSIRMAANTSRT